MNGDDESDPDGTDPARPHNPPDNGGAPIGAPAEARERVTS